MKPIEPPSPNVPRIFPSQYFEQRKKGQMNELKGLLNKAINQQDHKKCREVVKKIIGYMTLGMDASPVFSEMSRASFTSDQITKKMIYFYLTTYAEDNSDLSVMAINTFQKDCKHASSKVRGLALRNLCSFKSSDYVNNVLPTIRQLLTDHEPYVKKTAIMGTLKVFYHDPPVIFNDQNIISTLSYLIRDNDPLVSANAVVALNQIFISQGGIPLSRKLVKYLYNRLKQYSCWEQCQILDILYKYDPTDEKQHFQIMTLLWDKLKQSSGSLVLSSIRVIIKLAKGKKDLFNNVVQKIKAPLLTLMSANQSIGSFETTYVILEHIQYVICHMDGKKYYEKDFKYFYCKINQPTYTKYIKIKILGQLANQMNLGDMLNQLNQYVSENDLQIARRSVQILSQIAVSVPNVAQALLTSLISFYKTQKLHLVNESMVGFAKIFKKFPNLFNDLKPSLLSVERSLITQPNSIKSFIWILGTFATQIDAAPYILEQYIQNQEQFQKLQDSIKSVYLTHVVQCFLKRPPETIKTLSKIFNIIYNSDNSSMALKDHASFYYRALKDNVQQVKKGFNIIQSQYSKNIRQKDRLSALLQSISKPSTVATNAFDQDVFNNLSLVYRKKQYKFLKPYEYYLSMRSKQLGLIDPNAVQQQQQQQQKQEANHSDKNGQNAYSLDPSSYTVQQLDTSIPIDASDLIQGFVITAQQFEQIWNSLPSHQERQFKSDNEQYMTEQSIEELFKMWHLYCMASASEDDQQLLKFFIYAKHTKGLIFCLEFNVDKSNKKVSLLTKAPSNQTAHLINQYIAEFLRVNQFIVQ